MSINVYWSFMGDEWLRAKEPELIFSKLSKNKLERYEHSEDLSRVFLCPAVNDSFKNVYGLSSIYDYEFTLDRNNSVASSSMYDQKFFDSHVSVRHGPSGLVSFSQKYIFFTDRSSLKVTACIPPVFENNFISKNTQPIPGQYDIGKWFRPLDFAFFINEKCDSFSIKNEDIFSYIKFHTQEKINFIKFSPTEKIMSSAASCYQSTKNKNPQKEGLYYFYNMFGKNMKKNLIKDIRRNLI